MVEEVKYIKFDEVPEAPMIAVPADFTQDQINQYLKSDYVEQTLAEKGVTPEQVGDGVVNALTRDYSDLMKVINKKKKGIFSLRARRKRYK